jgi:ribonuclease P protein component
MRASLSSLIEKVQPGWDLVFLARKPITEAQYEEIIAAEKQLLKRAKIFRDDT